MVNARVPYVPVFVGKTKDDEKITIYKAPDGTFHIRRPDGELCALGQDTEFTAYNNAYDSRYNIQIKSEAWTGKASGTRSELIEEPTRFV